MTGESNNAIPSSVTSVGSFISGLSSANSAFGLIAATAVSIRSMRSAMPSSCAATITLRV